MKGALIQKSFTCHSSVLKHISLKNFFAIFVVVVACSPIVLRERQIIDTCHAVRFWLLCQNIDAIWTVGND